MKLLEIQVGLGSGSILQLQGWNPDNAPCGWWLPFACDTGGLSSRLYTTGLIKQRWVTDLFCGWSLSQIWLCEDTRFFSIILNCTYLFTYISFLDSDFLADDYITLIYRFDVTYFDHRLSSRFNCLECYHSRLRKWCKLTIFDNRIVSCAWWRLRMRRADVMWDTDDTLHLRRRCGSECYLVARFQFPLGSPPGFIHAFHSQVQPAECSALAADRCSLCSILSVTSLFQCQFTDTLWLCVV